MAFIQKIIKKCAYMGVFNRVPDEKYLKLLYYAQMNKKLNLKELKTYNEKLQWLKLNDRNPLYTDFVDKYKVKDYIADLIGEEYIIKTLGIYDDFNQINFDELPLSFVMKCTHDSGGLVICRDKNTLDKNRARLKIEKSLKKNYYLSGREWPYKDVKPRILIEEYIGDINSAPEDYKFFTFNGEIDNVMVCKGREKGYPLFYHYDIQWKRLYYQKKEPIGDESIIKPKNFSVMIDIVKKIAVKFKQVRVDLYNINGKIYFGEITLFNQSGFDTDITYETDLLWGKKIKI